MRVDGIAYQIVSVTPDDAPLWHGVPFAALRQIEGSGGIHAPVSLVRRWLQHKDNRWGVHPTT